jgi:hypothetical protein
MAGREGYFTRAGRMTIKLPKRRLDPIKPPLPFVLFPRRFHCVAPHNEIKFPKRRFDPDSRFSSLVERHSVFLIRCAAQSGSNRTPCNLIRAPFGRARR